MREHVKREEIESLLGYRITDKQFNEATEEYTGLCAIWKKSTRSKTRAPKMDTHIVTGHALESKYKNNMEVIL